MQIEAKVAYSSAVAVVEDLSVNIGLEGYHIHARLIDCDSFI
jgi:hypothetical protein